MNTRIENNERAEHEVIARRAKEIWEREGRQTGRDVEYWLRAERELLSGTKRAGNAQTQRRSTGAIKAAGTSVSAATAVHARGGPTI